MSARQYVYAIGRALDPAGLAAVAGIDGAAVGPITHREVVAVVSAAPSDEDALRLRLERVDELAAVARAHDAVVSAVAALTVTAPLRLATIYQSEQRVRQMLRERYGEFEALLDRLAGTVEVGVKLYADQRSAAAQEPSTSGRAYLQQLSRRHRRRDEDWRNAVAAAQRVGVALDADAVDRSDHRPQPAQLSGGAGQNIFNSSYLVPAGRVTDFVERARDLAMREPDLGVEVTGPWAPYSFAAPASPRRQ